MDLREAVVVAFKIAIACMTVSTGLATTTSDLAYLAHRPGLLARSLLATLVLAPMVAVALWRVLPIGPAAAIALISASIAPGLPSVPRTGLALGGNAAFACSLIVVTSALGVVTVPLSLHLLDRFAGIETAVAPMQVARTLALGILVPLGIGLAVRAIAPRLAQRLVRPIGGISSALMPGLGLVLLLVGSGVIAQLPWAALAAMVIAPVVALLVGHLLGGPAPRDRTVLAISNATRFPALAGLIATASFPELVVVPTVVASLVIAMLVAAPYEMWRKRVHHRVDRAAETPPRTTEAASATIATVDPRQPARGPA